MSSTTRQSEQSVTVTDGYGRASSSSSVRVLPTVRVDDDGGMTMAENSRTSYVLRLDKLEQ